MTSKWKMKILNSAWCSSVSSVKYKGDILYNIHAAFSFIEIILWPGHVINIFQIFYISHMHNCKKHTEIERNWLTFMLFQIWLEEWFNCFSPYYGNETQNFQAPKGLHEINPYNSTDIFFWRKTITLWLIIIIKKTDIRNISVLYQTKTFIINARIDRIHHIMQDEHKNPDIWMRTNEVEFGWLLRFVFLRYVYALFWECWSHSLHSNKKSYRFQMT